MTKFDKYDLVYVVASKQAHYRPHHRFAILLNGNRLDWLKTLQYIISLSDQCPSN